MLMTLFIMWMTFTMLDLVISGLAIYFGNATEVGLLFILTGDLRLMAIIKGVGALIFGLVLVAYKKKGLLALSCGLYALLSIWNGQVLLKSIGLL